jgi:hypothetical protein
MQVSFGKTQVNFTHYFYFGIKKPLNRQFILLGNLKVLNLVRVS